MQTVRQHHFRRSPSPAFAAVLFGLLVTLLLAGGCSRQPRIRVVVPESSPLLDLAAKEVAARLRPAGYIVEIASGAAASASLTHAVILNVAAENSGAAPESFAITPILANGFQLLRVTGADARSTLWGALEAADQIVSANGFEGVRRTTASPSLAIRARQLPLSLHPAPTDRDSWRQYFDLLARNRYNTVVLEAPESLLRYTDIPLETPAAADGQRLATIQWVRDLLRLARDRGLNPYLKLEKSSLAELAALPARNGGEGQPPADSPPSPQGRNPDRNSQQDGAGAPSLQRANAAANARSNLPEAAPSLLQTYPDLAGVVLSSDVIAMSGSAERRAAWVAENFLLPLAEENGRRSIFLEAGQWRPPKGSFGTVESAVPVYLLAPMEEMEESSATAGYPVVWQVRSGSNELLPWQDPGAVRESLLRIDAAKSAGFVDSDDSRLPGAEAAESASESPSLRQDWFRVMLWGRLGYSPYVTAENWPERFASHFPNGSGTLVNNAATHANQILGFFRSDGESAAPPEGKPPGAESAGFEPSVFHLVAGSSRRDLIADALAEKGLRLELADYGAGQASSLSMPEALEREARQVLQASDAAARRGAWNGADAEFYQRLQGIARMGLAYADYLRGLQWLARLLVTGAEDSRQQALRSFEQARRSLDAVAAKSSSAAMADVRNRLVARDAGAIEFGQQLRPWGWEKTAWEVGQQEAWQPASANDLPAPQQWQKAETARLAEFSLYGRQPWMSALNQQLRPAFLPAGAEGHPPPGALLVGRTNIPASENGRLILRVIANDAPMVWVNRHRAARISPQQVPWVGSSDPAAPLQAQLLAAPIQTGSNELMVAAAANDNWPLLSVGFMVAPEKKDTVRVSVPQQARLEGGLISSPASEAPSQAYIGLSDEAPSQPTEAAQPSAPSAAVTLRVRTPGFYRFRAWCDWRTGSRPGLTLKLDGAVLKSGFGGGDASFQKWHWVTLESAVGLGRGEHTLAITDWRPGVLVGLIELDPAW